MEIQECGTQFPKPVTPDLARKRVSAPRIWKRSKEKADRYVYW